MVGILYEGGNRLSRWFWFTRIRQGISNTGKKAGSLMPHPPVTKSPFHQEMLPPDPCRTMSLPQFPVTRITPYFETLFIQRTNYLKVIPGGELGVQQLDPVAFVPMTGGARKER